MYRIDGDIRCQHQETDTHESLSNLLAPLCPRPVTQSPEQHPARDDLNDGINSEADERDTAGEQTRRDANGGLDRGPGDRKIFYPAPRLQMRYVMLCRRYVGR